MTLGEFRRLTQRLPDDTEFQPMWAWGETPGDDEPGVEITGFDIRREIETVIAVRVRLVHFEEEEEDDG